VADSVQAQDLLLSETWNTVLARKQTPKEACGALNARVQRALDTAYASS
jgi:hypothetical protein